MANVGIFGLLGFCCIEDVRKKQIHAVIVCLFGIGGVFLHLFGNNLTALDMFFGAMIGLILYVVSVLTKEKIGKGDALIVGTMGVYLGFWKTLAVLWAASFGAAMVGMCLLLFSKKNRNYEMAFVPFLLVSYASLFIVEGIYA